MERRSRARRRSTSSCVSPGPRVPMPPPCCPKCTQARVSRGSMYCNCAISTCRRDSRVRAFLAKMSRMSPERSSTRRNGSPVASSSPKPLVTALACEPVRSSSKITRSMASRSQRSRISASFPAPIKVVGSKLWRDCTTSSITSAPAVHARRESSRRCSRVSKSGWERVATPTSRVRSAVIPTRWFRGACASRRRAPNRLPAPAAAP